MIHLQTKNLSFLKMYLKLKELGVKNRGFFLELYDKSLTNVDPFSEDLTQEEKSRIYIECCKNVWYFLREVARVPVRGKNSPYILNLGNLTLSWAKSKNINQITLLPRQHGKTIGCCCYDLWVQDFGTINSTILYLNKSYPDAVENLKRTSDLRQNYPEWLKDMVYSSDDPDNAIVKGNASRSTFIKMKSAPTSLEQADKTGRGLTVAMLYFDEFAFMKFNSTVYEAAVPAWSQASIEAKANGVPYSITITTTPNDLDTAPAKYCKKMIDDAACFDYSLFDMRDDELYDYVHKNSQNSFLYIEYNYIELGRDEDWFKEQKRLLGNNTIKIKREILLEWTISNDDSFFKDDELTPIRDNSVSSLSVLHVDGYPINIYRILDFNRKYIISCDVAGGTQNDFSAFNIIDPEDFGIVGDFKNNKIDTDSYRCLIEKVLTKLFPKSLLIVERNSYGLNILDTLCKNHNIEPRMHYEIVKAKAEKKINDGHVVKQKTLVKKYGIDTSKKSRDLMMELLPEIVKEEYKKIATKNMYDDLRGLTKMKNGKIEAMDGMHDDILMAYLIFRYAVFHGKTFKEKFGINSTPSTLSAMKSMSEQIKNVNILSRALADNSRLGESYLELIEQGLQNERNLKMINDEVPDEKTSMTSFFRNLNKF